MKVILLLVLFFSLNIKASQSLSIDINDSAIISSSFSNGSFDSTQLELILLDIKDQKRATFLSFCMGNLPEEATDNTYCENASGQELLTKWESNLFNRTYNEIITLLRNTIQKGKNLNQSDLKTEKGHEFVKMVSLALQIYENTKKGPLVPKDVKTFDYLGKLASFFGSYSIENGKDASNNSKETSPITPKNSLFWNENNNTYQNLDLENEPEEIDVEFEFSKSSFPFVVNYRGEKWAIRFPTEALDIPQEGNPIDGINFKIHPNTPQVGHVLKRMAAKIGYKVIPSLFKKSVKIRFSQSDLTGSSFFQQKVKMLNKLAEAYPNEILPKSVVDATDDFIELKGISLEKIYDEEKFLAFNGFPISTSGNEDKREYRAFALFAAWVDLPFLDDSIGAGILDVKNMKLDHMLYNLDYGLGYGYPNLFRNELVKKVHKKNGEVSKIDLTYKPFHKTELFSKMDISDAKWMAQKIASFKPDQLKALFLESGFPDLIADIFVKKLISRRNQLLEALDLVDESMPLEEGFENSIAGFEQFFTKDGFLIDRNNELTSLVDSSFPIYWRTTWFAKRGNHGFNRVAFKNYGRRLLSTINAVGADNLRLGPGYNGGMAFQELSSSDGMPLTDCFGNCFFQGLNIGVHTLLPYRFVIANPDKSSKKPFMIVDLFRLALRVGVGTKFYNDLGVSPMGIQPVGKANVYTVFEFIKTHPTDDYKQYTEGYKEGVKNPGLPIFGLQKKFIESMEKDDSILINKYIGTDLKVGAGWSAPINFISVETGIRASLNLLASKVLHKDEGDNVILNFSKLTAKQLSLYAELQILGIVNGFYSSLSMADVKKKDQVYLFNLKDEKENEMLFKSVKMLSPKNIPVEYKLSERLIHTKQSQISNRLFMSIMGHDSKTRKVEAQFKNFTDGTVQKEYSYLKRMDTFLHENRRIYDYKASINENGDMFFKVKTAIKYTNVKKERFFKFYPLIQKLVPEDFIVFDLDAIEEDLGTVKFNSTSILSGSGIKKLINFSDYEICLAFLEEEKEIKCQTENYPMDVRFLLMDLKATKKAYEKLGPNPNKKLVFKVLKELVDLQVKNYKDESLIKIFKKLIPQEDFYQHSTLTSNKAAFPGRTESITLSRRNKGTFTPSARHLAESVEEAYSIFSDELNLALRNYVFFKDPSLEYPRDSIISL